MSDFDRDAIEESAMAAEAMAEGLLDYARRLRAGEVAPKVFTHGPEDERSNLIDAVQSLQEARMRQAEHLGPYVQEPALDILLALFVAHLSSSALDVEQLCRSTSQYKSTARRWLEVFANDGLIEISSDGDSFQNVRLSERGASRVSKAVLCQTPYMSVQ